MFDYHVLMSHHDKLVDKHQLYLLFDFFDDEQILLYQMFLLLILVNDEIDLLLVQLYVYLNTI